jgi:hypothetical protein
MNTIKFAEIGRDGLAMIDLRDWCLIVNFDFYIDESSWDSFRCEFRHIDVTIKSIEWGTPDGDVVESHLTDRNKTRIIEAIQNHIDQNVDNWGVDTSEFNWGDEYEHPHTL